MWDAVEKYTEKLVTLESGLQLKKFVTKCDTWMYATDGNTIGVQTDEKLLRLNTLKRPPMLIGSRTCAPAKVI